MKTTPKISDAEWEVMNVIWEKSPRTAQEIVQALAPEKKWNAKTIGTFLTRLMEKGVIRHKPEGKRYLYFPKVKREACIRAEGSSFLERVFGGRGESLLAHFVEEVELSTEEIGKLKDILDKKQEAKP